MENGKSTLLEEYLSWLDGLCACYLSIQQAQCPGAFQGRGVVVPESQVSVALSGQCRPQPQPGFAQYWQELEEKASCSDEPLAQLFRRIGAHGIEQLAILLAIAPEVNRKYARVFAYLQDDAAKPEATLGLAADLWGLTTVVDDVEIFDLCDGQRLVNRIVLHNDATGLDRKLTLRESALIFLTAAGHLPMALVHCGEILGDEMSVVAGHEGLADQAKNFVELCYGREGKTGLLELYGTEGVGRRSVISYVAGNLGRSVLCIDCKQIVTMSEEKRKGALQEALSWASLHGAIPTLIHFDWKELPGQDESPLARELLDTFRDAVPLLVVCGEQPLKAVVSQGFLSYRMSLPGPSIEEQRQCWIKYTMEGQLPFEEGIDTRQLAGIYTLTPGQIRQAIITAQTDSIARGKQVIDREAISLGVRALYSARLRGVAEPLKPSFGWEDLVVDDNAMQQLQQLCNRIRCRFQVNEEWGFDRKLPYGKGVSVCLYGPPGTGKTMTAQVLSREFSMDAYRVDMSRIIDKYIGETEKKLAELFDAARDSNAILFFDEADALFAKRTEIGDSKDKYANVETAYLLQRMENHNGICILATNAVQNFDEAFKRRITYMVPLLMPDIETRKKLWSKVFPKEAPLENVDLDFFAERFELSGSSIKNIALSAAYLAAAGGGVITHTEIATALQSEYRKMGRLLMEADLY